MAGVVGSALMGSRMDFANIVVTDMGGTTLDVATVEGGKVGYRDENEIVRQLAHLRKVDVESVGAGGGSIAWIDEESGTLRVGPHSAGAVPGPICYGRGGTEVTVTDADLVLGVLNPDRPLAGGLRLDVDAARPPWPPWASASGSTEYECAAGMVEIVDSRDGGPDPPGHGAAGPRPEDRSPCGPTVAPAAPTPGCTARASASRRSSSRSTTPPRCGRPTGSPCSTTPRPFRPTPSCARPSTSTASPPC